MFKYLTNYMYMYCVVLHYFHFGRKPVKRITVLHSYSLGTYQRECGKAGNKNLNKNGK